MSHIYLFKTVFSHRIKLDSEKVFHYFFLSFDIIDHHFWTIQSIYFQFKKQSCKNKRKFVFFSSSIWNKIDKKANFIDETYTYKAFAK